MKRPRKRCLVCARRVAEHPAGGLNNHKDPTTGRKCVGSRRLQKPSAAGRLGGRYGGDHHKAKGPLA